MKKSLLSDARPLTTEDALEKVGNNGRFQKSRIVIFCLVFWTVSSSYFAYAFYEQWPYYNCPDLQSNSLTNKQYCKLAEVQRSNCTYNWNNTRQNLITKFHLDCDHKATIGLFGTSFNVGRMISAVIILSVADIFGRRPVIFLNFFLCFLMNWALVFINTTYVEIYVWMFFSGLSNPGASTMCYVAMSEMVGPSQRATFGALLFISDLINMWTTPLLFYFFDSWTYYPMFFGIVQFFLFFLLPFIPETPRFLVTKRKFPEARVVYKKIAQVNRKEMFTQLLEGESNSTDEELRGRVNSTTAASENLCDLLKSKSLMKALVILSLGHFIKAFSSGGITFDIKNLPGGATFNMGLLGMSVIFGFITSGKLADVFGRKKILIVGQSLTAVMLIIHQYTGDTWNGVLGYITISLGKYGVSLMIAMLNLLCAESFPTKFRGFSFAVTYTFSGLGDSIAPMTDEYFSHPLTIYGFCCAGMVFLSLFLSETKDKRMSNFVSDEIREESKI